jgi:hypothetical protein
MFFSHLLIKKERLSVLFHFLNQALDFGLDLPFGLGPPNGFLASPVSRGGNPVC